MANPMNVTGLSAIPKGETQEIIPALGSLPCLVVKDYDAAGRCTELSVPMPDSPDFGKWTVVQQIAMLKRGPWQALSLGDIMFGLAYAHSIGADVMKGELFPTGSGRFGTSNKYKIKQALETGRVKFIETAIRDTDEKIDLPGCIQKTDLECTVTIGVKGFEKPVVRRARLSRWYKKNNPNWAGNPEHMLELNTVAHACEYIVPGGTEDDEAPPTAAFVPPLPEPDSNLLEQLTASVASTARP